MLDPKKPLFTRKNILLVAGFIMGAYIVLIGGVLIKYKVDQIQRARAEKQQIEKFKSLSKEEKSIRAAENYFMDSVALVGTSERIFLSYLQRKFDLPDKLGVQGPPIDLHENPRTYPAEIHYLARIAYPDRIVRETPKYELDDGAKVTNIYSVNCDHLALPANFWPTMEQNISAGGYYLTHAALALTFLKDNGCSLPPNTADLKRRVAEDMVKLADDPTTIADLRYEAVAFLLMSGRRDLVQSKWIDQITSEQRKDGGWSMSVGENKTDHHATLLAFWAILEYARPGTGEEPIVRRPSSPTPAP